MPLTGTFATMPFPELLQWLGDARRSGSLILVSGLEERNLRLVDGEIVALGDSDPRPNILVDLLLAQGLVTEESVRSAQMTAGGPDETRARLLAQGVITAEELDRAIDSHVRGVVLDFLFTEEGRFVFADADEDAAACHWIHWDLALSVGIRAQGLVMDGLRRLDEWRRMREVFPHDNVIVHALAGAPDLHIVTTLAEVGEAIPLGDLAMRARAPRFRVVEQLSEGLRRGLVAIEDAAPLDAQSGGETKTLLDAATALLDEGQFEEATSLLRAIRDLDPLDPTVGSLFKRARTEHVMQLYRDLPPRLRPIRTTEDLGHLDLTAEERHIFHRINGRRDIATLLVVTPLGELQTLRALSRLRMLGVVRFEG